MPTCEMIGPVVSISVKLLTHTDELSSEKVSVTISTNYTSYGSMKFLDVESHLWLGFRCSYW